MAVDDQAGDLVVLEGNDGLLEELAERNVRQRHPRRDHLLGAVGGNSRQPVARARRGGLGQQVAQIVEHVAGGVDGVTIDHGGSATTLALPLGARGSKCFIRAGATADPGISPLKGRRTVPYCYVRPSIWRTLTQRYLARLSCNHLILIGNPCTSCNAEEFAH